MMESLSKLIFTQSAEANGVTCSICTTALPKNQFQFEEEVHAKLYIFFDLDGQGKKFYKYIRIFDNPKYYCMDCVKDGRCPEGEQTWKNVKYLTKGKGEIVLFYEETDARNDPQDVEEEKKIDFSESEEEDPKPFKDEETP